ncbi:MAG: histidinol-phosphate transaminase [Zoogloeaceae bacterium]|jgi:histidinol-phosphate aminotransferase|nr:histidinol-phosphate transaminase [Zoogloeaceae bacterium]
MSRYWSTVVYDLDPYVPGEQPRDGAPIKLNTNENPYPPSPKAVAAIRAALEEDGARLARYPDPDGDRLKAAIARHYARHAITPRQVFVGNSSDEVLSVIFQALFRHEAPLLLPDITYGFYTVYCGLYGIAHAEIPLDATFAIRPEDYQGRPNGGIIFPNPNAPTGRALALADIERIARANPDSVVTVDEAYVDFGAETAIALTGSHPNLLVTQTFSKSRALAGLRVGFAVGHPDLIEGLERVKNCFNSYPLDHLAIIGASAAMDDTDWFERNRRAVMESRDSLADALIGLGFQVIPSKANFVFVHHPRRDAAKLARHLRDRGIIVRHFNRARINQHLRITIGTPGECAALVDALSHILTEKENRS